MQIDALEKEVFDARAPHFRQQTLQLGKELLTLNRYYEQLININEHLEENSNDLFAEDELRSFTLLNERMLRYRDNVQLLRDRLTQAQQSYQAQLDYQLNKSMKTLSLVTTICLPLSLIAGWYGMNFTAMPELKWRYGYLYVKMCIRDRSGAALRIRVTWRKDCMRIWKARFIRRNIRRSIRRRCFA